MSDHKIVIVDDEVEMTQLLRIELETEGYQIFVAHDGREGLELIKKEMPQLAILDVMMPKLDGYELLKLIKDDDSTKDIPVIMLTAKGLEDEISKGLSLGADDYVSKPFHGGLLIKKIGNLLK